MPSCVSSIGRTARPRSSPKRRANATCASSPFAKGPAPRSALRPVVSESFVAGRQTLAHVLADLSEGLAAGGGGERQRLDLGAGPDRRAQPHQLHRPVYGALVHLLHVGGDLGHAL